MKVIIEEKEALDIMESYVRKVFELTPEYGVKVSKKSYQDTFDVSITHPEQYNKEEK